MRFFVLVVFLGCAQSPQQQAADPGPRSGLDGARALQQLTDAERVTLCTWWGETLGGVGRMQSCSECDGDACTEWDVTVSTQAECVKWLSVLQCDATVVEAEDCAFSQKPDLCASPAACDALTGC